jgi:hypothetical protein
MNTSFAQADLLFQRFLAVAVCAATIYCVASYPFARVFLGLALAAYAGLLWVRPGAWLWVIPVALPLVNFAPWSGRFYLEDFDFFIWTTLAVALWQGAYGVSDRPRFARLPSMLIAFFLATHCIALLRGLLPFAAVDANAFSNYYSHYNALRVGKSLLWAVLLIPPLLRAFAVNPARARNDLSLGVCIGLLGTGIAVLWERGVFVDLLYAGNIYAKFSRLTNMSSNYRITGLFSEMHTGGEAIDGYLAMAWPFALGTLIMAGSLWTTALGAAALPAGLYSALVTYSRGTYVAVAVSLLSFGIGISKRFLQNSGVSGKSAWPIPPLVLAAAGLSMLLYQKGGFFGLVAALGMLSGAILLGYLKSLRRDWQAMALLGLFLAGFLLMMRGMLTSKWVSNSFFDALIMGLPFSAAFLLAGLFMGNRARAITDLRGLGISLVFLLMLFAVCIPGLSGSYMQSRFSTTEGDAGGRFEHWKHAVGLMTSSWDTYVFGMGLGVFPHAYLWGKENEKSSIAALQEDGANTYLKLSNSMDLAIGQRLGLEAGEPYTLSLDARTLAASGSVDLSLCRRHILSPSGDACIEGRKIIKQGPWQHIDWQFNIGQLGDGLQLGRRPLVMRITHFHFMPEGENNLPLDFIDIDNIRLKDRYGEDHVINGNFQAGLDNWFPYSDHYHLPLHIKNLWVDVYFEQGALGLIAFAGLNLLVLVCGFRLAKQGDLFALTLFSSLLGLLSVGVVGTLYDVPRVIFFFFLLQFVLLAQDPAQLSQAEASRKSGRAEIRHRHSPAKRGSFIKPTVK